MSFGRRQPVMRVWPLAATASAHRPSSSTSTAGSRHRVAKEAVALAALLVILGLGMAIDHLFSDATAPARRLNRLEFYFAFFGALALWVILRHGLGLPSLMLFRPRPRCSSYDGGSAGDCGGDSGDCGGD